MTKSYRRIDNLSHSDTIYYEIDMLRFTAGELEKGKTERGAWAYLEAFLTRFRNLIEFLGKPRRQPNPNDSDIHVVNIWKLMQLPVPPTLEWLQARGTALWDKYGDKSADRISQYLHHCTQKRIDGKDWPIGEMMREIEPLLGELEEHLGHRSPALPRPFVAIRGDSMLAASTSTWTATSFWQGEFYRK